MTTILCYGDSNTYGYNPVNGLRYPKGVRWTGVLQKMLGEEYEVIEEGCNGRTTVFEDAIERSKELPVFYEKIAKKYDCIFFNAAKVIESSKVDSLHLMPEAHKKLAEELYKCIMENE